MDNPGTVSPSLMDHTDGPAAAPPDNAGSVLPSATASVAGSSQGPPARRQLRARPSEPAPIASPVTKKGKAETSTPLRRGTDREIDYIRSKLAPENIVSRRDAVLKAKEAELKEVIDQHDTAVREVFHLERYVSIFEGWNPRDAKQDNSPVFLEYKRSHHNLLDLAPSIPVSQQAGPSRHRQAGPSRTTRRQATEQAELFSSEPKPDPHATEQPSVIGTKSKGKGKARQSEIAPEAVAQSPTAGSMLPPPIPAKSKKGRRATLDPQAMKASVKEEESEPGGAKGKKRGRPSLPNLPAKKLRHPAVDVAEVTDTVSPSPSFDTAEVSAAVEPTPPSPPALPSLAHLPFPDPPARDRQRSRGPRRVYYTDTTQLPSDKIQHGGDIESLLNSYIHLEDTGPTPDLKSLELRAAREAYFRNRVNYLQQQGRLLRLLDEEEDEGNSRPSTTTAMKPSVKAPTLPARTTDHRDSLMAHMVQVRNAMLNEAKAKPLVCKRIARMIQAYWDHIEGKEERERLAEERERKRQMKDLMKGLRKKWALAVKVVRAKLLQIQKEEQDRLGKEHLQNMLQRSTGLIEAHRDEFAGREEGDEDSRDSDGTEDVSSVEDSDEDEDEADESDAADDEAVDTEPLAPTEEHEPPLTHSFQSADAEHLLEPLDSVEAQDGDPIDTVVPSKSDESDSETAGDSEAELALLLDDDTTGPVHDGNASTLAIENGIDRNIPPLEPEMQPSQPETTLISPDGTDNHVDAVPKEASTMINGHANHAHVDHPATNGDSSAPTTSAPDHRQSPAHVKDESAAPSSSSPPALRARPSRKRKRTTFGLKVNGTAAHDDDDPYADDVDFKVEVTSDQDEKDIELDEAMDEADAEDRGASEDEGLLADADLPIEELLKRYGYEMPNGRHVNGHDQSKEVKVDQSLTDESLAVAPTSPALVIEGKRQRRVRSVWTPEDNPPPIPKKPKVQVVDADEGVVSDASTPKFTSSEEEEEDDEEDEGEAASGDGVAKEGEEEADPNRLRPPFLLRGTLRPYQHDGLEWLASLYANNMNGILADEMGLGKTIQTIALLAHLACDKGIWGQHLIIVPTSVILNWEMEFKKFLPGIKVLTYYGNQKERKEKRIGWHTQHHFQVCITSYQIVLADQHIFRRKSWVYMILDEAHNIKNFRSQRWQTLLGFKAQKRLLLTGTPLQNNLMELWSLLYFLMPGGVTEDRTSVVGFANHKEFTEWFSNPMDKAVESGDVIDEETLATVNKLHTLLRPFILRRLKSEVETQLPGKFEHVVYCRLSKRQRFLYDEFMSRASTKEALTSGGYLGVVNTLMQLRKVCNHPDLFEVRPVRTSFAMDPVAIDYEPTELLVRKRLLARTDDEISLDGLNLLVTANEGLSAWTCQSRQALDASDRLPYAIEPVIPLLPGRKAKPPATPKPDTLTVEGWLKYRSWHEEQKSIARWRSLRDINRFRCGVRPYYGSTFLRMLTDVPHTLHPSSLPSIKSHPFGEHAPPASSLIRSYDERARVLEPLVNLYAVIPPNAVARGLSTFALPGLTPSSHPLLTDPEFDTLHPSTVKLQIAFPDSSLLQYDCGKLQTLYTMLRDLKANGHRVLIFTQMTRVLDILEMFLSYNGHRYLRLDGSTKIEDRQIITERFNSDSRIFCFIASSRSGGVGINLTGADTVFFYDSDWNPSMDRQCMDRAHRIGQTREVNIYRFVSTHTVEENMLKKANQKRLLDKVVIQQGEFTTDFFGKMDWRDVLDADAAGLTEGSGDSQGKEAQVQDIDVEDEPMAVDQDTLRPRVGEERELAKALAEVEDEEDAVAARVVQGEGEMDLNEFGGENKRVITSKRIEFDASAEGSGTPVTPGPGPAGEEVEEDEEDDGIGGVDEYMLRLVEWDWSFFVSYRA